MRNKQQLLPSSALLMAGLAFSSASASELSPSEPSGIKQSVQAMAETEELSDGQGSLRTVTLEYKFDDGDTAVVLTPAIGERKVGRVSSTAFGIDATLYQKFSDHFSTRTHIAIAEDKPAFANREIAQDISFGVAPKTTATVGARWARYFGGRDVYFLSAGVRYYFKGGSVAYRLSYADPERRDAFFSHLVNISVNDGRGRGKTQLWLSAGAASIDRSKLQDNFSGRDYGVFVRRLQPLNPYFSLIGTLGLSSYDRPVSRVTASSIGLGFNVDFGKR